MEKIKSFLKTTKGLIIIAVVVGIGIGFFLGMEYKKYEIRKNLEKAFSEIFITGEGEENKNDSQKTTESIEVSLVKRAYIENSLILENIWVEKKYKKYRAGGIIKNIGGKTLYEVEITIYFLDENDKRIGEENYHPILVSDYSFLDNKPLRPNYTKDFDYVVEDDAPSGWTGKVEIAITDIDFQE